MLTDIANSLGISVADLVTLSAIVLVVITLMATFALSIRPRKYKRLSSRQYNAELFKRRMELDELSYPMLNDITIGGTKSGVTRIDHVMRLPTSILLIMSAPADAVGTPRCNPNMGRWRYLRADHSVGGFLNPVVQLHPLISAIRSRFPLVRVRVLCVFPRTVTFDGKSPRNCATPDDLVRQIRDMAAEDGAANPAMDPAWESISQALQQSAVEHGGSTRRRRVGPR